MNEGFPVNQYFGSVSHSKRRVRDRCDWAVMVHQIGMFIVGLLPDRLDM